jgi:hypothetical protein
MKKSTTKQVVSLSFFLTRNLKKALLPLTIVSSFNLSYAQYIDAGLKGDISSAWFLNSNILKGGTEQGYDLSVSHEIGVHGAMCFEHGYGIQLEILEGTLSESYHGAFNSIGGLPGDGISYQPGENYNATTTLDVITIPVLFRHELDITGKYFEAGLAYQLINSANYTATYNYAPYSVSSNVTAQYPNSNFLVMVGMGWNKRLSREGNMYFNIGFRATYGLYDLGGVDGHGQDLTGPNSVILYEMPSPYYKTYSPTHLLDVSCSIGLFYRFYPTILIHKRKINF